MIQCVGLASELISQLFSTGQSSVGHINVFYAIFLGLLQGITEFLPISSSGHLALVEFFLGIEEAGLAFDVALHLGTLLGVLIYFRRDFHKMLVAVARPQRLGEEARRQRLMAFYICLGTIPVVVAGLLMKDVVETVFRDPIYIAAALAGAGLLLVPGLVGAPAWGIKAVVIVTATCRRHEGERHERGDHFGSSSHWFPLWV